MGDILAEVETDKADGKWRPSTKHPEGNLRRATGVAKVGEKVALVLGGARLLKALRRRLQRNRI